MKVLVACEESQRVCCALRNLGYEACSTDISDLHGDIVTIDGKLHCIREWDLVIANPPCNHSKKSRNHGGTL